MLFPVHCVVYICRQGLALLFLAVIANVGYREALTSFCDIYVQSDTNHD